MSLACGWPVSLDSDVLCIESSGRAVWRCLAHVGLPPAPTPGPPSARTDRMKSQVFQRCFIPTFDSPKILKFVYDADGFSVC